MTNGELREKLALALEDMKAKAIEMGIEGVVTALHEDLQKVKSVTE